MPPNMGHVRCTEGGALREAVEGILCKRVNGGCTTAGWEPAGAPRGKWDGRVI